MRQAYSLDSDTVARFDHGPEGFLVARPCRYVVGQRLISLVPRPTVYDDVFVDWRHLRSHIKHLSSLQFLHDFLLGPFDTKN